jgi:hypothetical protein
MCGYASAPTTNNVAAARTPAATANDDRCRFLAIECLPTPLDDTDTPERGEQPASGDLYAHRGLTVAYPDLSPICEIPGHEAKVKAIRRAQAQSSSRSKVARVKSS